MTKRVDNTIPVNCIEGMLDKLKTVLPVLKRFVNLKLKASHATIVTMVNLINGKILEFTLKMRKYPVVIGKKPKSDFSLFLRDWYHRGIKFFRRKNLVNASAA